MDCISNVVTKGDNSNHVPRSCGGKMINLKCRRNVCWWYEKQELLWTGNVTVYESKGGGRASGGKGGYVQNNLYVCMRVSFYNPGPLYNQNLPIKIVYYKNPSILKTVSQVLTPSTHVNFRSSDICLFTTVVLRRRGRQVLGSCWSVILA